MCFHISCRTKNWNILVIVEKFFSLCLCFVWKWRWLIRFIVFPFFITALFFFLSFGVRDAFQIIFYWWKIFLFHHTNTWYTLKTHKINKFYYLSSNKNETYVVVAKRSTPTKKPAKVRTKQPKSSKKVKFISKYLNIFALIVLLLLLTT